MTIAEQIEEAKAQENCTVEQFALLTQYHPKSLYRMIKAGRIPVIRLGPRTIRIPRILAKAVRAKNPNADQALAV